MERKLIEFEGKINGFLSELDVAGGKEKQLQDQLSQANQVRERERVCVCVCVCACESQVISLYSLATVCKN